ncbi:alcohol dehydrogenase catalytic domain-containing protein [Pseudomonas putida]|jgi:2-desacetyl-2-hydroxyethyl bacteriochlorophyllide A dehydrogenase|uniref:alcohol dehydrogenase catalytic domain-containing protein n=1 Tax=Pseudomonas putida TaxID=303 RepID=UPI00265DFFE1|nr:alcohol dehydrogenase catalytic domain-containing protein [Pseudomonas putida]MDO1496543.1 alcohol dehydrogenase catalytic domain-containing protein [Pseudomonas putida]
MKALCYRGPRTVHYETVADARLEDDGDIVLRMEVCGICGSDLHVYHGQPFPGTETPCFSVGHEAVGEVMEVGKAVRRFRAGDRVMLSASVGCGACRNCLIGNVLACTNAPMRIYGIGRGLPGCQAEAIRVPAADVNASLIPEGISVEQAIMLTDNLPTAWFGCLNADIQPGDTVAVVGLGPIGLMAVESAFVLGASRVFAIDLVAERRKLATQLGAIALEPASALNEIREATGGRMAHCAVEAVGLDATIQLAISLVARQGTVSMVGAGTATSRDFPIRELLIRNLTFRAGVCSVQEHWEKLIHFIQQGRLHPERFVTHTLPLNQGADAYRMFDARTDGVLKMLMTP